jgi:hypothetical protein
VDSTPTFGEFYTNGDAAAPNRSYHRCAAPLAKMDYQCKINTRRSIGDQPKQYVRENLNEEMLSPR